MLPPSLFSNWVLTPITVTGSTINGPDSAVLLGGDGLIGSFDEGDTEGEKAHDLEANGALGIVARPRPPDAPTEGLSASVREQRNRRVGCEGMGARIGDGTVLLALRDLRLNRVFPNPKPGTIALVGYGGSFLSFDDTDDISGSPEAQQKASSSTWYVPFDFDSDGLPQKAHAITLDPETNALSVVHADGASVLLQEDTLTLRGPSGATSIVLDDEGVRIYGNVKVMGRMAVGIPTVGPPPAPLPVVVLVGGTPTPCIDLTVATP